MNANSHSAALGLNTSAIGRYAVDMLRSLRSGTIALTSLAFLFASLSDAHSHVHLSADSGPSAASHDEHEHHHIDHHVMHLEQVDTHDEADVDIDVPNQAIIKAVNLDLPVAAAIHPRVEPAAAQASTEQIPAFSVSFHPPPRRHWRPPLRAPPR